MSSKDEKQHLFDLSYSEGAFIAKDDIKASFLFIKLNRAIPHFVLDRENIFGGVNDQVGYADIDFDQYPDFSRRFYLGGKDPNAIRAFFNQQLIFFFESHRYYRVESTGDCLLIKGRNRLSSIQEIKRLLAFSNELMSLINPQTHG